jgi:hypothetical protein
MLLPAHLIKLISRPQRTKELYLADVHGDEQVRARLEQSFMLHIQAM